MRENADQNNSEYGRFLRNVILILMINRVKATLLNCYYVTIINVYNNYAQLQLLFIWSFFSVMNVIKYVFLVY